jgi:hypothetical protein
MKNYVAKNCKNFPINSFENFVFENKLMTALIDILLLVGRDVSCKNI